MLRCPLTAPPDVCRRTGNLQKRIDEKKDKKIKKRENKLMRAGFEGRKSGTI